MFKYILLFIFIFFITIKAKSQNTDTVITYIKNVKGTPHSKIVSTLDSADYFRIIYPPDNTDTLYNIKEFYKDGKIKFVGKFDLTQSKNYHLNQFWLSGYCISYYPNGKKQDISNYVDGKKDGLKYLYRPNGHLYCIKKHVREGRSYFSKILGWECFDDNGNMICHDGNGKWLTYDPDLKKIILSGLLKNGMPDGQWRGISMSNDSIKYTYTFDNGICKSAVGYDSLGVAYPFTRPKVFANYKYGGVIEFIRVLRSRLSVPKDTNGKRMNIDTVHFAFVIEKNGQMSNIEPCGNINPTLKNAIILAAKRCNHWIPTQYYGVPYRTKFILPLNPTGGYSGNDYLWSIKVKGKILDFMQAEPDLPYQGIN